MSLLFVTVVPAPTPYIPMLYFPFTLIVPLFSIFPVVAGVLESPIYPAAIPTLNILLIGSDPPTDIVPVFLAFPFFTE